MAKIIEFYIPSKYRKNRQMDLSARAREKLLSSACTRRNLPNRRSQKVISLVPFNGAWRDVL
jgi:hypothetical protein